MAEKKSITPKVRYQGRTYEIVSQAGKTIRVRDMAGFAEFFILMDETTPANKEARELFKRA